MIGFGSTLYDTVNKVYRYYYISTNYYLFDRAYTISTNHDMTDFFDRIFSLNLDEKYYFQRPSSGWVLVGLFNVEMQVTRKGSVPIGAGVQLPARIKSSKSIVTILMTTYVCFRVWPFTLERQCVASRVQPID